MNINWVPKKSINTKRVNSLIQSSLDSGQFTNYGPNVRLLEELIKDKLEIDSSKAVICVANGSAAVSALVSGINMFKDQRLRWATQSFTFPSSAQGALENAQIVDIDGSGGLDLEMIEPTQIDGIIVTNVFGNIVDIDLYIEWCQRNKKILLFDNAATAFTFYKGKNALNYGNGCIVSFHHTKPLGFGEGGAIIVDKEYEYDIRRCLNFGIDNNAPDPHWDRLGGNYKMSDISAVYIIQYLDQFSEITMKHKKLYREFTRLIEDRCCDIKMFPNFSDGIPFVSCFCLLSLRFTEEKVTDLQNKGIFCRKYYNPLLPTPMATQMYGRILCLPCNKDLTSQDLRFMVNSLLE